MTMTVFSAGLDVGSVQIKLFIFDPEKGITSPILTMVRPHMGQVHQVTLQMFKEVADVIGENAQVRVGLTGAVDGLFSGGDRGGDVAIVNQIVAVVDGIEALGKGIRTVIDLGGQFSKWILVHHGQDGVGAGIEDFAVNGLCAAGSGVFLEQQAARLQLSVAGLGRLAEQAKRGATIAGRCSVFAKSDMIHLQQKGTPMAEIAYGLCLALARTFAGTVLEKRNLEPPVALIGGGAANPGLVRAFCSVLNLERHQLLIPENSLYVGSLGAALAASTVAPLELVHYLAILRADSVSTPSDNRFGTGGARLVPLAGDSDEESVLQTQPENVLQDGKKLYVHLGIDVGSVSTKVALLNRQLHYLDGVYLPTAGKPVAALDKALATLAARYGDRLIILSVGTTGSGRYLAARLTGADLVKNEITAQLVSTAHFFPEVETIFEIGGQDAKFMNAKNGLLQDFEMNKICSAGTGSFLEEQAERLGVSIIDEFSELAFRSSAPVDLGSRCTVFMDGELCQAMAANYPVEDLCAGLAQAVARNYLEKVVAGRKIGSSIIFQGGTSANSAVVSAFTGILGRQVRVHPYGRVSGAIGAALLAAQKMTAESGGLSSFRGLDCCRDHTLKSFECGKCENRCQVNQIGVGGQNLHFGDVCERYSAQDALSATSAIAKKELPFPELFAARDALLDDFLPKVKSGNRVRVGLVKGSLMFEYLPFWAHLLAELNFEPVVATGLAEEGEKTGLPPAVCLPQKLAAAGMHHLFRELNVEKVLLPSLLELETYHRGDRANTCIYSQQLPDMVGSEYGTRLLTPQLGLSGDGNLQREGRRVLAETFGMSTHRIDFAWKRAMARQDAFGQARRELGREALATLAGNGVVIIGKPYNLHDPRTNLGLAVHMERLGLPAIPMDLLPLSEEHLAENWYMLPWLLNRNQLRTLQHIAVRPQFYPVHVSNYGCGPDAFTLKHLKRYWGARPRLFLEFDGHRGEAGLITRLEAFTDEIEHYSRREKKVHRMYSPPVRDNLEVAPGSRFLLPFTSEHVYVYAGMLQRAGFITELLPLPDGESIRLGEEFSSGRECHPYTIIAGDLIKCTLGNTIRQGDRFFIPGSRLPCLISQYGDGFRHILKELGENRIQIFDQHPGEAVTMFGNRGMIDLYDGVTIIDYLIVACCHARPYEEKKGSLDRWLTESCVKVQDCLAVKGSKRDCLRSCLASYARITLGEHERRPVIGVTGDFYTRINGAGNGGLFSRLEEAGCEVWPSPFLAASTDFELPQDGLRWRRRGKYGKALSNAATAAFLKARSKQLASCLGRELHEICVEPPQAVLQQYALPYVKANSNHLIRSMVAKMVDFSRRGADGVISVIGLNCMAGTAAAAAIQQIRKDNDNIPLISIAYGGTEGVSQKMQLDTFVNQVFNQFERSAKGFPDKISARS